MASTLYSIQDLSDKSGFPRRTIHFYIQQGILPPATGAGLAAGYDEFHLLRLRLVPLLRRQGLRLDAIRDRLNQIPPARLSALLEQLTTTQLPPLPSPQPTKRASPQACLRYALPAGLELVAPADLNSSNLARLQQLLQAAEQIFNSES